MAYMQFERDPIRNKDTNERMAEAYGFESDGSMTDANKAFLVAGAIPFGKFAKPLFKGGKFITKKAGSFFRSGKKVYKNKNKGTVKSDATPKEILEQLNIAKKKGNTATNKSSSWFDNFTGKNKKIRADGRSSTFKDNLSGKNQIAAKKEILKQSEKRQGYAKTLKNNKMSGEANVLIRDASKKAGELRKTAQANLTKAKKNTANAKARDAKDLKTDIAATDKAREQAAAGVGVGLVGADVIFNRDGTEPVVAPTVDNNATVAVPDSSSSMPFGMVPGTRPSEFGSNTMIDHLTASPLQDSLTHDNDRMSSFISDGQSMSSDDIIRNIMNEHNYENGINRGGGPVVVPSPVVSDSPVVVSNPAARPTAVRPTVAPRPAVVARPAAVAAPVQKKPVADSNPYSMNPFASNFSPAAFGAHTDAIDRSDSKYIPGAAEHIAKLKANTPVDRQEQLRSVAKNRLLSNLDVSMF